MKITSQEEYGIRLLLRIASNPTPEGLTISQLSQLEGLSRHYVAKLCRLLRMEGFIHSTRGKEGGYRLARAPGTITLNHVLSVLGGKLFSDEFCRNHAGELASCSHQCDCSVRSVWQLLQTAVDHVLDSFTLEDLLNAENGNLKIHLKSHSDVSPVFSE